MRISKELAFDTFLIFSYNFMDFYIPKIEATGSTLVCAFGSGVLRVVTAAVLMADVANDIKGDYVRMIQVMKPHKIAISAMSLNPSYR